MFPGMKWFLSVAAIVAAIIFGPLVTDAIRSSNADQSPSVDEILERSREQRERVERLTDEINSLSRPSP